MGVYLPVMGMLDGNGAAFKLLAVIVAKKDETK